MEIEKLKWMIERADGFSYEDLGMTSVEQHMFTFTYQGSDHKFGKVGLSICPLYPLLLQRTIEGCIAYRCMIDDDYLTIIAYEGDRKLFAIGESVDQAKQSAIDYIYNIEIGE